NKVARDFRAAITNWSASLGHKPTLDDLSQRNAASVVSLPHWAAKKICSLWRMAAKLEYVSTYPPSIHTSSPEPKRQRVYAYFAETYLPDRLASGDLSPDTIRTYRYSVRKFDEYTGGHAGSMIDKVNQ